MSFILPPSIESVLPLKSRIVNEPQAPKSETITMCGTDEYQQVINKVRVMITMAIGCLKELKSQAVEKYKAPGMRFLIGEILACLGHAKQATGIKPEDFSFTIL